MSFTKREGNSYIDGIPVKISEKYRPPRKVVLPLNFQNRFNPDIFNLEYDFTLERQIFEDIKQREAAAAAEEIENEIENQDIEELPNYGDDKIQINGIGSDIVGSRLPVSKTETETIPKTSLVASMNGSEILTPLPSSNVSQFKNESSIVQGQKFNPADFEADTSSPFDNMELKTINELEELNTVFQGMVSFQNESNQIVGNSKNLRNVNEPPVLTNTPSTVAQQNQHSYPTVSYMNHAVNADFSSAAIGLHHNNSGPQTINIYSQPGNYYSGTNNAAMYPCTAETTSEVTRYSPVTVNYGTNISSKNNLRNSKSASDLTSMDSEVAKMTGNGRRLVEESVQRPKSVEPQNQQVEWSRELKPNVNELKNSSENLTRNFKHLDFSDEQMKHIKHFSDMGFPSQRVARAVLIFGTDEKKIVDRLCHVQNFSEMGYQDLDIEDAFETHDSNLEKVEEFLKLIVQLKDIGFDKVNVKKALVSSNNDRDKALDLLISWN